MAAPRLRRTGWPAAAVFLYFLARDGEQVIGGLDPDFTVNAWGGPTYLGAMACHYLDGLVLMAAAAWLLDLILLPDHAAARPPPRHRSSSARSRASYLIRLLAGWTAGYCCGPAATSGLSQLARAAP